MSGWKPTDKDKDGEDPFLDRLQRPDKLESLPKVIIPKRTTRVARQEPPEFIWIWMFGTRLPAITIAGEPSVPLGLVLEVIASQTNLDVKEFQKFLKMRSVFVSLAHRGQVELLCEKSEHCRKISAVNLELIRRSDIERLLGELRVESEAMKNESDFWNHYERFLVTHYNFVDLDETLFENGDLEEDVWKVGIRGWFYPSRRGERCIICVECHHKFTPNDFAIHFHLPPKYDGVFHFGLCSAKWSQTIVPLHSVDLTEENMLAWERFCEVLPGSNKRRQDLRIEDPVIRRAFEKVANLLPKKKLEANEEHIRIIDREATPNVYDFGISASRAKQMNEEMAKLHPGLFDPSKLATPIKPFAANDDFMKLLQQPLTNLFNQLSDDMLFKKPALPMLPAAKAAKVAPLTPAIFDWKQGEFKNLCYQNCSEKTKYEINLLKMGLRQIEQDSRKAQNENSLKKHTSVINSISKVGTSTETGWQAVLKEQNLLKGLSDEAICVLDGKPIASKPPVKLAPPKVVDAIPPLAPLAPITGFPLSLPSLGGNTHFPPLTGIAPIPPLGAFPLMNFKQPLPPVPMPVFPSYDLLLKTQQLQNLLQMLPQLPTAVTTSAN